MKLKLLIKSQLHANKVNKDQCYIWPLCLCVCGTEFVTECVCIVCVLQIVTVCFTLLKSVCGTEFVKVCVGLSVCVLQIVTVCVRVC